MNIRKKKYSKTSLVQTWKQRNIIYSQDVFESSVKLSKNWDIRIYGYSDPISSHVEVNNDRDN